MRFPSGSVGETLTMMQGVWHDHIRLFTLDGEALSEDSWSGTPGLAPFDNLVYIDFDGEIYCQTNVTFRGRPLHVRSFRGVLQNGVLKFGKLGPSDPSHIGVAAGPGQIIFCPQRVTDAWQRYAEPDWIQLNGTHQRTRTTLLYRDGVAVRTLVANGTKLSPDASRRHPSDPRGDAGLVHEEPRATMVFHDGER